MITALYIVTIPVRPRMTVELAWPCPLAVLTATEGGEIEITRRSTLYSARCVFQDSWLPLTVAITDGDLALLGRKLQHLDPGEWPDFLDETFTLARKTLTPDEETR